MTAARDHRYEALCAAASADCPPEEMNAEDPLFILYTSGSTGKPKGVLHTTGGYMVWASFTHEIVFDYRPGRDLLVHRRCRLGDRPHLHRLWPARERRHHADVRGHPDLSRRRPLLAGGGQAQGEHLLHRADRHPQPDARGRGAGAKQSSRAACGCSAPSASRSIPRPGCGTTAWWATHRCPIVDTWWQTETGGILITPLPGAIGAEARLGDAAAAGRAAGAGRCATGDELEARPKAICACSRPGRA